MKAGFRQSMASLHTWAGLLPGWLLFVIFLFGTSAFFQQEISRWMRPELRNYTVTPAALEAAGDYLREKAPHATAWNLTLPPPRGGNVIEVSWDIPEGGAGESGSAQLDPSTGKLSSVRDTQGGWFLYRFHYDLHYMPIALARYIVCIAALAMLVALLSGIVTHKKIFADFFLLRFRKGQRSWLDAHNVTGVLALPFYLMITYTGLVALLFTLMPWAIIANFPTEDAFWKMAYPEDTEIKITGQPAPVMPLPILAQEARAAWGGRVEPGYIQINNPGDAAALAILWPSTRTLGGLTEPVRVNAATGIRPPTTRSPGGAAKDTNDVMIELHTGIFAGPVLRWLYFLAGAAGTVMMATGLVLWTVKRRSKLLDPAHPHIGFRIVERLNIGVIAGAPAGIAGYFLANRLLPRELANRADWEIHSLFLVWVAFFVWTFARPAHRAWIESLAAAALLFALIPVVNALTTERGLIPSLWAGDIVYVSFDIVMIALAAGFFFAARKAAVHPGAAARRRRTTERQIAEAIL